MGGGYSVLGVSQWMWHGQRTYGRAGYLAKAAEGAWNLERELPDLSGHVYVVTGANAGLGKATALALAKKNATVHMVCRDRGRGEVALADIREVAHNTNVHLHVVDVSDVDAVKDFATRWIASGVKINALINNAGVLLRERQESRQGIESVWATMMVQTYLLTGMLAPALAEARPEPGRVVNVSSGGQYTVRWDAEDPLCVRRRRYDGTQQYAHAKRAQVMLTEMIAEKLQPYGVKVNAMHPGWAETPGVTTSIPDFAERHKHDLRSPEQGADTMIWLAAAPALRTTGKFFFDRDVVPTSFSLSGTSSSPADYDKLWQLCGKLCEWEWRNPESASPAELH